MKNRISLFLLAFSFFASLAQGQDGVVSLVNPSFEGMPAEGTINGILPKGWFDCGFPGETAPDVHPKLKSAFGVTTQPYHGKTYLGLVVRENDTWEMIGQKLNATLKTDTTYLFKIALCRSIEYSSPSRIDGELMSLTTPVILRIWGGHEAGEKNELLAKTQRILNTEWEEYEFVIMPSEDYEYIVFEAFYNIPVAFPYNGNLLLDHASDFVPIKKD